MCRHILCCTNTLKHLCCTNALKHLCCTNALKHRCCWAVKRFYVVEVQKIYVVEVYENSMLYKCSAKVGCARGYTRLLVQTQIIIFWAYVSTHSMLYKYIETSMLYKCIETSMLYKCTETSLLLSCKKILCCWSAKKSMLLKCMKTLCCTNALKKLAVHVAIRGY